MGDRLKMRLKSHIMKGLVNHSLELGLDLLCNGEQMTGFSRQMI